MYCCLSINADKSRRVEIQVLHTAQDAMTEMAIAVHCTRNFIAGNHRQAVSSTGVCLVQGGTSPRKTCPVSYKDFKDGPQLALMHRLHGPSGALLATDIPQWPRY